MRGRGVRIKVSGLMLAIVPVSGLAINEGAVIRTRESVAICEMVSAKSGEANKVIRISARIRDLLWLEPMQRVCHNMKPGFCCILSKRRPQKYGISAQVRC